MNQEVKQKWLTALRSGEYIQGRLALKRSDNTFCCLGVLVDIYLKERNGEWIDDGIDTHHCIFKDRNGRHNSTSLTSEVCKWSELNSSNPLVRYNNTGSNLMELNDDHQLSFLRIADIIEEQL